MHDSSASELPALFVSHGAPSLALDPVHGADFAELAGSLPRPRAWLVVSAHWEATPLRVGAVERRELLHDYGGFDPRLREVRHDAPAAPDLAREVRARLPEAVDAPERPWDHGVWVPLVHINPTAATPVLQLSLPSNLSPAELLDLGARLRPLRDQGVGLLASGGFVHNLGALDWTGSAPPPTWALEFEGWLRATLAADDRDALADLERRAPALSLAHPTPEHLLPLLVARGAADDGAAVSFPIGGFEYGSLSRTAVRFG